MKDPAVAAVLLSGLRLIAISRATNYQASDCLACCNKGSSLLVWIVSDEPVLPSNAIGGGAAPMDRGNRLQVDCLCREERKKGNVERSEAA